MFDSYNRDINYLRISVTDRCNLRCTYCMPKEGLSKIGHDDILRYEEIFRVVKISAKVGITKIRITGGEPLVRRGIVDFIASLRSVGNIDDISLTTNGVLLEAFAHGLFHAGMRRINVSLDSLDPLKYAEITRGGDLTAVLRGIAAAHQAGFSPIKINTVAIKGFNDDEILDFARQTLAMPYQIRFIELMPVGNASLADGDRYLSNEIVKKTIGGAFPLEPFNGRQNSSDGPARIFRIRGGMGEIGFISPFSQHFCHACNRLRLTADGHLRACLLSDDEVDLKGPLRAGCSDEVLEELMRGTILRKPKNHNLTLDEHSMKKCVKDMPSIGG